MRLPRSTRTIHRILCEQGRIFHRLPTLGEPQERPEPMQQWQLDFKDASSVPADPQGKQQHVVETLNVIDMGTSVLLAAHVAPDFTAETALQALAQTFQQHGLPHSIRLDRDPRWVGAPQGSDFPSAVLRFCRSLGIGVLVCDPRHPQQNGWVERYHRSYGEECLDRYRPRTVEEVRQVTATFVEHYNWQRPHQGVACGNRPPRVAHPELPALPRVPDVVNADGWVRQLDGQHLVRQVNRHGSVTVNLAHYYLSRSLAGQRVTLRIDGVNGLLLVQHPHLRRKSFPRKRLAASGLALSALSGLDAAGGIARTPSACSTAASGLSTGSGLPLMLRCQEAVVLTMLVSHTAVAPNADPHRSQNAPRPARPPTSSKSDRACQVETITRVGILSGSQRRREFASSHSSAQLPLFLS